MLSRISIYRETDPAVCFSPFRNLAVEKYLTFHVREEECILYLWQNRRTVVIGKNQNPWKECRIDELNRDGGYLVRRLSGGGAVYHDLGNLNFTFCARKANYDVPRQLEVILRAVRALGAPAEKTGRNDLTCEGRKFSGNAFFRSGDFCCHHGTLMMDVDSGALSRYLAVSPEKLQGKGVDSVRSRVVNLKEYCPEITADLLAERLEEAFSEVYGLPAEGLEEAFFRENAEKPPLPESGQDEPASPQGQTCAEIRRDTGFFASREWNYGRNMPFTHSFSRRYSWGGIEILMQVNRGTVADCVVHSDAMDPDFAGRLAETLKGQRYEEALRKCEAPDAPGGYSI